MSDGVLEIFRTAGAVKEGHFLLASGLHSPVYWEKFRILQQPSVTEDLCGLIARHFRGQHIDLVAGPTTGGVIIAFETARQLGVRSIFAEKEDGVRVFRRDFAFVRGERVLVVDDVWTTGGSVRETIAALDKWGAVVVGVGVFVDRSDQPPALDMPFFSCLRVPTEAYAPGDCPLCAAQIPLVKPGSPTE